MSDPAVDRLLVGSLDQLRGFDVAHLQGLRQAWVDDLASAEMTLPEAREFYTAFIAQIDRVLGEKQAPEAQP